MKRMTYDPKANAAYAYGLEEKIECTAQVNQDINVDLSAGGRVVGIEILNAKAVLSKALGTRLNPDDMEKIEYEIEQKSGIYLHIRHDAHHASLVMPGRLTPS